MTLRDWINKHLNYERFATYCGDHAEIVVKQKWRAFSQAWPAVSYILTDAEIDMRRTDAVDLLFRFQDEVGQWQNATFPSGTRSSLVAHLRREIEELDQAKTPFQLCEELADCFLLLCGIAHREDIDLLGEARLKLEINKTRVWGTPDAEGVVEHVG